MKYQTVLFDLDGTLTDPAEGILNSVRYALERSGEPIPSDAVLNDFIGPPLYESPRFSAVTLESLYPRNKHESRIDLLPRDRKLPSNHLNF